MNRSNQMQNAREILDSTMKPIHKGFKCESLHTDIIVTMVYMFKKNRKHATTSTEIHSPSTNCRMRSI